MFGEDEVALTDAVARTGRDSLRQARAQVIFVVLLS